MSQTSHLPPFAIRPRFEVELSQNQTQIVEQIRKGFTRPEATCIGLATSGFATIKLPEKDRHFWSPQLSVMMEDLEDRPGTLLRGLYSPAPAVWTMFVFFYAIVGFALMVVSIIGFSRLSLDMSAPILWWLPVLGLLLLSLYLVSFFGQKMGHNQMERLHSFLENCLGMEIDAGTVD